MIVLFHAHSGLRFLVLLAALAALAYFAFGLATRRPVGRAVRAFGSTFVGLLDLQILLGVALALSGRWYPALIGHLVMMLLAAIAAHVLLVINRRRARPGFALPFAAIGVALALIIGGIYAIPGRGPFTVTGVG
jgi:hypothetical protein